MSIRLIQAATIAGARVEAGAELSLAAGLEAELISTGRAVALPDGAPYSAMKPLAFLASCMPAGSTFRYFEQFWEAIRRGSCKVLFLGDSVTQNVSQNWSMSHWVVSVQRELRAAFPWVNFTFVNMAIGGREARHVLGYTEGGAVPSTTLGAEYVSVTSGSPETSVAYRLDSANGLTANLEPWVAVGPAAGESAWGAGEVWMNRLPKHNFDLMTLCFGLNEENAAGAQSYFAQAIESIIDHVRSAAAWAGYSRPSIVLATPYNDTITRDRRNRLAECMRAIGAKKHLPLIDFNRWDGILVEGKDQVRRRWFGEMYLRHLIAKAHAGNGAILPASDRDQYWHVTGTPSNAGGGSSYLSGGGASLKILRKRLARDVQLTFRGSAATSGSYTDGILSVWYRVDPENVAVGYEVRYLGTGTLRLYYHDGTTSHLLAEKSVHAFAELGERFRITVRCEGGRHQVWTAFGSSQFAGGSDSLMTKHIDIVHTGASASAPLNSNIFRDGWAGFQSNSAGATFPAITWGTEQTQTSTFQWGDPLPVADGSVTAFDLNGSRSEWIGYDTATSLPRNPDTPGGNTINHLTTDGYPLVCDAAVAQWVRELAASRCDAKVLGSSGAASSVSASTNEEILATIPLPAGLLARNSRVELELVCTVNNNGNNKTIRARLGSTGITSAQFASNALSTHLAARYLPWFQNRDNLASQVAHASAQVGASAAAVTTMTVDTSQDQNIYITGQKANSGDTLTLESYSVRLVGG